MNRRDFIRHGAFWVPTTFAILKSRGQAFTLRDPAMVRKSESAVVCSLWSGQLQTTDTQVVANNFSEAGAICQKIKNTTGSSVTICKVKLKVAHYFGGNDINVQIRTAENGGGSQYGTTATVAVSSTTEAWYDWDTWATKPVIPANTDFWINVVQTGLYTDNGFKVRGTVDGSGAAYQDTNYCMKTPSANYPTYDICFEIYIEQ